MSEDNCSHPDSWFDRSICPEPCGSMHYICTECGEVTDHCPLDDLPPTTVVVRVEDWEEIVSALYAPARPIPALVELLKKYPSPSIQK